MRKRVSLQKKRDGETHVTEDMLALTGSEQCGWMDRGHHSTQPCACNNKTIFRRMTLKLVRWDVTHAPLVPPPPRLERSVLQTLPRVARVQEEACNNQKQEREKK